VAAGAVALAVMAVVAAAVDATSRAASCVVVAVAGTARRHQLCRRPAPPDRSTLRHLVDQSTMAPESRDVVLVHGPSTGGIRRHVEALATALPAQPGGRPRCWPYPVIPWAGVAIHRAGAGADVVHATGSRSAGGRRSCRTGRPSWSPCTTSYSDEVAGWRAPLLRRLEGRLPSRVDAVIGDVAGGGGRSGAATSPPSSTPFGPAPRRCVTATPSAGGGACRRGPAVVVAVGGSIPRRAWTCCSTPSAGAYHVPAVQVILAGEGPLEHHLRRRIAAEDLAGRVRLVGPTPDPASALAAAPMWWWCRRSGSRARSW